MSPTRDYGTVALRVRRRRWLKQKGSAWSLARLARYAKKEKDLVGPYNHFSGGSCCIDCKRYVDRAYAARLEKGAHILQADCDWCGRVAEDVRVIEGLNG